MSKVKAYAIHTIHRRDDAGKPVVVPASVLNQPSVFSVDQEEFDRLEKLNAVRKATKEEIAVANEQAKRAGNAPVDEPPAADDSNAAKTPAKMPASGAQGDPAGAPKGAAKKSEASDDGLGV